MIQFSRHSRFLCSTPVLWRYRVWHGMCFPRASERESASCRPFMARLSSILTREVPSPVLPTPLHVEDTSKRLQVQDVHCVSQSTRIVLSKLRMEPLTACRGLRYSTNNCGAPVENEKIEPNGSVKLAEIPSPQPPKSTIFVGTFR